MPDIGEVRIAAYEVMRKFGLDYTSVKRVRDQMILMDFCPGSERDLVVRVKQFKSEQASIAQVPPVIVEKAKELVSEFFRMIKATRDQMELQRGGAVPEPVETGRGPQSSLRGGARIAALQRAIEDALRPDASGDNLISAPLSASELFRELTDKQAKLSNIDHISRDLRVIAKQSKFLCQLPDGKWWLSNRPLPPGYGDHKVEKAYVRRGTPLSQTRMDNRALMNDVIAVLLRSERALSWQEIAAETKVPTGQRQQFRLMLRNQLRAKNPRITRNDAGLFACR